MIASDGVPELLPRIVDRPCAYARTAGILYLLIIGAGLFAEVVVRQSLIVPGDPFASMRRIAAAEGLWSVGAVVEFAIVPCALVQAVIEFGLLRVVHRDVALFAFAVNLVSIGLEAGNKMFLVLAGRTAASGMAAVATGEQADSARLLGLVLRAHDVGFHVSLFVFGIVCLPLGFLIFRSGFLPRAIGVLMLLAGIGYLVGAGSALFWPALARLTLPEVLVLPLVGELSFCLWLIFKGVDAEVWHARRAAEALSIQSSSRSRLS